MWSRFTMIILSTWIKRHVWHSSLASLFSKIYMMYTSLVKTVAVVFPWPVVGLWVVSPSYVFRRPFPIVPSTKSCLLNTFFINLLNKLEIQNFSNLHSKYCTHNVYSQTRFHAKLVSIYCYHTANNSHP